MEFQRLTTAEDPLFNEAFALYEISFPIHEQRKRRAQEVLMANPLYHFDVILEDGAFAGILLHWQLSGYFYIEHFAIHQKLRGKSMGTKSLEEYCKAHPLVILEIDPPLDEVSRRRERFYQRLGFVSGGFSHIHPPYRAGNPPHPLVVMSCPRALAADEYQLFRQELSTLVMRDSPGKTTRAASIQRQ